MANVGSVPRIYISRSVHRQHIYECLLCTDAHILSLMHKQENIVETEFVAVILTIPRVS